MYYNNYKYNLNNIYYNYHYLSKLLLIIYFLGGDLMNIDNIKTNLISEIEKLIKIIEKEYPLHQFIIAKEELF